MTEIDEIKARLARGDERFSQVTEALGKITNHLQQQDAKMECVDRKIDKVIQGTEDVVSMWNGGVQAVRFRGGLAHSDSILRFLSGTSEAIRLPI